jgi:hypothetical protein
MPRNSSGTYTLPGGNPVATNTVIETAWANPTMSDLGGALTDSLDRYGRGTMLSALKIIDGAQATPGLSFNSETSSGLYRAGSHDIRLAVAGVDMIKFTDAGVTLPLGITGVMKLPDGTFAAPALTFASDTTMGLFKQGVKLMGIANRVLVNTGTDNTIDSLQVALNARVRNGASGVGSNAAALAGYDEFVIEGSAAVGMSFLSPNNVSCGIAWGDPQALGQGFLLYDHSVDQMKLGAVGLANLVLDAAYTRSVQPVYTPDGTAAVPAYAFTSQPTWGLFRVPSIGLGFSVAGAEVARLAAAGMQFPAGTIAITHNDTTGSLNLVAAGTVGTNDVAAINLYDSAHATLAKQAFIRGKSIVFTDSLTTNEKARFSQNAYGELAINTSAFGLWSAPNRGLLAMDGTAGSQIGMSYGGTRSGAITAHVADFMVAASAAMPLILAYNGGTEVARCDTDGTFQYKGVEVGYRDIPVSLKSAAYPIVAADRGTMIRADAGCTGVTAPTMSAGGPVVTVWNNTGGNITLTAGSGLTFRWGTGTPITTSPRTLANNALVTIYWISGVTAVLTGTGIS